MGNRNIRGKESEKGEEIFATMTENSHKLTRHQNADPGCSEDMFLKA